MGFDPERTNDAAVQGRRLMVADVVRWFVGGFLAPQTTVRRLLDGNHGYEVAAQLVLLGFLIAAIFVHLLGLRGEIGSVIGWYFGSLIQHLFRVAALSLAAWHLGRISGGTGTLMQMILGISWHSMMIALLWPFVLPFAPEIQQFMLAASEQGGPVAPPEISQAMRMSVSFAAITSLWLMANTIAAVHGFRNVLGVMGVIVGIPFALMMLLAMLSGGGA